MQKDCIQDVCVVWHVCDNDSRNIGAGVVVGKTNVRFLSVLQVLRPQLAVCLRQPYDAKALEARLETHCASTRQTQVDRTCDFGSSRNLLLRLCLPVCTSSNKNVSLSLRQRRLTSRLPLHPPPAPSRTTTTALPLPVRRLVPLSAPLLRRL